MGRPRLKYLKKVARNTRAGSCTAMHRMDCNKSRWKTANQSKDEEEEEEGGGEEKEEEEDVNSL